MQVRRPVSVRSTPPRTLFMGSFPPRECGIATFTTDLQQALTRLPAPVETGIVAMTDHDYAYDYPAAVRFQINEYRRN